MSKRKFDDLKEEDHMTKKACVYEMEMETPATCVSGEYLWMQVPETWVKATKDTLGDGRLQMFCVVSLPSFVRRFFLIHTNETVKVLEVLFATNKTTFYEIEGGTELLLWIKHHLSNTVNACIQDGKISDPLLTLISTEEQRKQLMFLDQIQENDNAKLENIERFYVLASFYQKFNCIFEHTMIVQGSGILGSTEGNASHMFPMYVHGMKEPLSSSFYVEFSKKKTKGKETSEQSNRHATSSQE